MDDCYIIMLVQCATKSPKSKTQNFWHNNDDDDVDDLE